MLFAYFVTDDTEENVGLTYCLLIAINLPSKFKSVFRGMPKHSANLEIRGSWSVEISSN